MDITQPKRIRDMGWVLRVKRIPSDAALETFARDKMGSIESLQYQRDRASAGGWWIIAYWNYEDQENISDE